MPTAPKSRASKVTAAEPASSPLPMDQVAQIARYYASQAAYALQEVKRAVESLQCRLQARSSGLVWRVNQVERAAVDIVRHEARAEAYSWFAGKAAKIAAGPRDVQGRRERLAEVAAESASLMGFYATRLPDSPAALSATIQAYAEFYETALSLSKDYEPAFMPLLADDQAAISAVSAAVSGYASLIVKPYDLFAS